MSNRFRHSPRRNYGTYASEERLPPQPSALSKRFSVDDVSGAAIVGSLLNTILESFASGRPISQARISFLRDKRADAFADLIENSISETEFVARSAREKALRIELARQQSEAAEATRRVEAERAAEARRIEAERQEAIRLSIESEREAERIRREASPEFKLRRMNQELLRKYEIVERVGAPTFKRLMQVLKTLEAGARLIAEDVVWLYAVIHEHKFHFHRVLHVHHRREADTCIAEFKREADPWQAINASKHLRKCDASSEAIDLLKAVPETRLKQPKIKSAKLTTQGGALRDVGRLEEAQRMGEEAHDLLPTDFRPCTLLGAIHIQQGNYGQGHEWYRKAEERGAKSDSIESEIRALIRNMSWEKQRSAREELRRIDPDRYGNL